MRSTSAHSSPAEQMDCLRASACTPDAVLAELGVSVHGLSEAEHAKRLLTFGPNALVTETQHHPFLRFFLAFGNPLVALLIIIGIFSFSFSDRISAMLVWLMAIVSVVISFVQEERAGHEARKLKELVHTTAAVRRNGKSTEEHVETIVPGDIVDLEAGDIIPADVRILSAKDLFVSQAALTGESLPIEKSAEAQVIDRQGCLSAQNLAFFGTSVVSGVGTAVVLRTGKSTEFGALSAKLSEVNVENSFHRGIRRLTWLIIRVVLLLVCVIFLSQALTHRNLVEAVLFSLAVAVGLTPDMLPMIVTITLSKGALALSKKKVIVKKLPAIQDLGAMDILCTDKTGTLTMDKVVLEKYCDVQGNESEDVLHQAYLNSYYQTGLKGLLDRTILAHNKEHLHGYKKVDEVPFDFERKIMSVIVDMSGDHQLIAKGAPEEIFRRCTQYMSGGKILPIERTHLAPLEHEYDILSQDGFRVLAVASKSVSKDQQVFSKKDEEGLTLLGYLAFLDPPKPTARQTLSELRALGVEVKVLTGDNAAVTAKICRDTGLSVDGIVIGSDIDGLSDEALGALAATTTVFARLSPLQKERVVRLLKLQKHVVGYLGDGINDAPALRAADVGISVQNAVDIAKESADMILLQKSLHVLKDGIVEGRRIFSNILKYIRMGLSSNFGNMFTVTIASIVLPFLPMLPIQILLTNFLYDFSQLTISTDDVDDDEVLKPHPWDTHSITRFMLVFGGLSSLFDFLTFGILLLVFQASPEIFRTGWFLTSLCTQTLVIHIIRTKKIPFAQSVSSPLLFWSSILLTAVGFMIPYTIAGRVFGFVPLPAVYVVALAGVCAVYFGAVQVIKIWFVRKWGYA